MNRRCQQFLLIWKEEPERLNAATGIVTMSSTLTTQSLSSPLRAPTGTSVDRPRIVPVIGATVTLVR